MFEDVRVWTEDGLELDDAMVVVGVPTLGLVGTIVSHYIQETLEMDAVGGVRSAHFPPMGRVDDGRLRRPFAIHSMETSCGPEGRCDHLVVVYSDFLPHPPVQYGVSRALVEWASDNGARLVVAPDGLHAQEEEGEDTYAVASSEQALAHLRTLEIDVIAQGVIGGFSSQLLFDGEELGVPTVCLLAESSPEHPDARAASRLVHVLDRVVPDVRIEAEPLLEEAERIEEAVRDNRRRMQEQTEEMEGPGADSMMFS